MATLQRQAVAAHGVGALVVSAGLGLAGAMGVGRFAFTPLLPVMAAATGSTPGQGALVATATYAGYFVVALVLTWYRRWRPSHMVRVLAVVLVFSEAAMAATSDVAVWVGLRFAAGTASAGIFVVSVSAVARLVRREPFPRCSLRSRFPESAPVSD